MTRTQLLTAVTHCHQTLGFLVDDEDAALYSLVRHTTPRRFTRAVETVAGDETCTTVLERYNKLLGVLGKQTVHK